MYLLFDAKPSIKQISLFSLIAFFILLSGSHSEAGSFKRRYSTTIRDVLPWSATRTYSVNEVGGSIQISSEKRENIKLKGIRTCFAPDLSLAKKLVNDINMLLESRNENFTISTSLPASWLPDVSGRIDYFLTVPATSQFALNTFTGDIGLYGLSGKIAATTVSGDIEIVGNKATVVAKTVSGDIFATRSPSIVSINSITGEIRLRIANMDTDRLDINSFSGPVKIKIAAESNVTINASTVMGIIETKPPKKVEIVLQKQNRAVVRAGEGTKQIYINTVSGGIIIEGFEEE